MEEESTQVPSTRLFIKQMYSSISSSINGKYLVLNDVRRIDAIRVQGIVTKIFKYQNSELRALLDDGTAVCVITNIDKFIDYVGFRKGCLVSAYGDLSIGSADSKQEKLALLHPERLNVITDPNIETLWALDIIHNFS